MKPNLFCGAKCKFRVQCPVWVNISQTKVKLFSQPVKTNSILHNSNGSLNVLCQIFRKCDKWHRPFNHLAVCAPKLCWFVFIGIRESRSTSNCVRARECVCLGHMDCTHVDGGWHVCGRTKSNQPKSNLNKINFIHVNFWQRKQIVCTYICHIIFMHAWIIQFIM